MDKKGVFTYLAFTFGVGYAAQFALLRLGFIVYDEPTIFNTLLFLAVMWIPAMGALAVTVLCPGEGRMPRLWPVPFAPAVKLMAAVPLVVALSYAVATLLGLAAPQWDLSSTMMQLEESLRDTPPNVMAILPPFLIVTGLLLGVVLGATVFAAAALGSELGWRGCLLPRLAVRGRAAAHLVTGVLWGLWFMPLVFWRYYDTGNLSGFHVAALCGMAVALVLGAFLNEIVLCSRNLGLAALALGLFVGQREGIWQYLFPTAELPWAGVFGVFTMVLLLALVFAVRRLVGGGAPSVQEKPEA